MSDAVVRRLCHDDKVGDCAHKSDECSVPPHVHHMHWNLEDFRLLASATCGVTAECDFAAAGMVVRYAPGRTGSGNRVACKASWYVGSGDEAILACNKFGEVSQLNAVSGRSCTNSSWIETSPENQISRADVGVYEHNWVAGTSQSGVNTLYYSDHCGEIYKVKVRTQITAVSASDDGQWIAVGERSGDVLAINIMLGKQFNLMKLSGDSDEDCPITGISWKSDSTRVVYCSPKSSSIKFWSAATPENEITEIRMRGVQSVAFYQQLDYYVAAKSMDGSISFFSLDNCGIWVKEGINFCDKSILNGGDYSKIVYHHDLPHLVSYSSEERSLVLRAVFEV